MRSLWGVLLVLWMPLTALGAGPGAVRKTVEMSMLITGQIEVDAMGDVAQVALDRPEKLPEGVREFVPSAMRAWKFEPPMPGDTPAALRNRFTVRLVANRKEDGGHTVRISSAKFKPYAEVEDPTEKRLEKALARPPYPQQAGRMAAEATVYLLLKVGMDGSVHDVVTEQVTLYFVSSDNAMNQWRKLFADASTRAAREFKFPENAHPVLVRDPDGREYWVARVPIAYRMHDGSEPDYGQWEAYVPGPWTRAPWQNLRDMPAFRPDALAAGGVYPIGGGKEGLRLLTPLQEGS